MRTFSVTTTMSAEQKPAKSFVVISELEYTRLKDLQDYHCKNCSTTTATTMLRKPVTQEMIMVSSEQPRQETDSKLGAFEKNILCQIPGKYSFLALSLYNKLKNHTEIISWDKNTGTDVKFFNCNLPSNVHIVDILKTCIYADNLLSVEKTLILACVLKSVGIPTKFIPNVRLREYLLGVKNLQKHRTNKSKLKYTPYGY